jgi:hypothetical protein
MNELRCRRHLHAILNERTIEVRCQQCSKDAGKDVFHRWDTVTGEVLGDAPKHEAVERSTRVREVA